MVSTPMHFPPLVTVYGGIGVTAPMDGGGVILLTPGEVGMDLAGASAGVGMVAGGVILTIITIITIILIIILITDMVAIGEIDIIQTALIRTDALCPDSVR